MDLKDRLTIAMKSAGISQAELARMCGVKPPSVSGWLSGKAKFLRGENLLAAANALNVSQQWLATGEGAMKPLNQQAASIMAKWFGTLSEVEQQLALSSAQAAVDAFRKSQSGPNQKRA